MAPTYIALRLLCLVDLLDDAEKWLVARLRLLVLASIAVRPICGPCTNSAKLYQEAPNCEWSGPAPAVSIAEGESSRQVSPNGLLPGDAARAPKQLKRERSDEDVPLSVHALQARIGKLGRLRDM